MLLFTCIEKHPIAGVSYPTKATFELLQNLWAFQCRKIAFSILLASNDPYSKASAQNLFASFLLEFLVDSEPVNDLLLHPGKKFTMLSFEAAAFIGWLVVSFPSSFSFSSIIQFLPNINWLVKSVVSSLGVKVLEWFKSSEGYRAESISTGPEEGGNAIWVKDCLWDNIDYILLYF